MAPIPLWSKRRGRNGWCERQTGAGSNGPPMTARDTHARRSGVARLTKARPQGQKSLIFPFGWQTAAPWFSLRRT